MDYVRRKFTWKPPWHSPHIPPENFRPFFSWYFISPTHRLRKLWTGRGRRPPADLGPCGSSLYLAHPLFRLWLRNTRKLHFFLAKFTKAVATRAAFLAQMCIKSFVGWGFASDSNGGAYSDFNIHLDNPSDHASTYQFLSVLSSFNLIQHVNFPTHSKNPHSWPGYYLCRLFSCHISIHLTLFSVWSLSYFH